MGSTPISTAFLLTSLAAVVLLEAAVIGVGNHLHLHRLWLIAASRTTQASAVVVLASLLAGGLSIIGLDRKNLLSGLKRGLAWSAGFAAVAGLLSLCLFMVGLNPLRLIRSPLPTDPSQRMLFFLVGGIVAPVTEEIVFRGLVFGYLRRWGVVLAIFLSTAMFAAIHLGPAIPVTQIIGGAVFAIAYQRTNSLVTPIVIHMSGNLAIFALSLPLFQ